MAEILACCSCEDIKEIVRDIVKEEVKKLFDEEVIHLKTESKKRTKRAPSKYNLFIGDCMKGGGKTMKECTLLWKEKKKEAS